MKLVSTIKSLDESVIISPSQCICKVKETRGGGLFIVDSELNHINLVSLPSKFQKLIWVKRGGFVVVEPALNSKTKITGEIVNVLFINDIKDLKSSGKWPLMFTEKLPLDDISNDSANDSANDSDDDLFVNRNRMEYDDSD